MTEPDKLTHTALEQFAASVAEKTQALAQGEPEAQLHGPVTALLDAVGQATGQHLTIQAESHAPGRVGIPDFAVLRDRLLIGYVETKAPGTGADASRYSKGHNRQQWERFRDLPNILYTDGNEWALFQDDQAAGRVVRFAGDVTQAGAKAVTAEDATALQALLAKFLAWEVVHPAHRKTTGRTARPLVPDDAQRRQRSFEGFQLAVEVWRWCGNAADMGLVKDRERRVDGPLPVGRSAALVRMEASRFFVSAGGTGADFFCGGRRRAPRRCAWKRRVRLGGRGWRFQPAPGGASRKGIRRNPSHWRLSLFRRFAVNSGHE